MALNKKIRHGTLINWEAISEGSKDILRGLPEDYRTDEHILETRKKSKDLELMDLSEEISNALYERICNIREEEKAKKHHRAHSYTDRSFSYLMLKSPFVEKDYILQVQDAVTELKENPDLFNRVDRAMSGLTERLNRVSHLFHFERSIDFITKERRELKSYKLLGMALENSESTLFKDLSDIFQSHEWKESPVGDYYQIVNSKEVKIKADRNGFQLYAENDDIEIDFSDQRTFSPNNDIVTQCLESCQQKVKAGAILEGSRSLLAHVASLAAYAEKLNLTKPEINDKGYFSITQGYHPILMSDRRRKTCEPVKHDTHADSNNRVLAVTGPNAGGKSTYIKELALMSALAQAGSYVPAESASLPIYKRMITHFGSSDNIMEDLSLFQSEITDLNKVLGRLEEGTLLVCDELFKGTESGKKGGALLHRGVVEAMAQEYKGRVILSSHYHESLADQQSMDNIKFCKVEMDESGKPLYTISEGVDEGGYAVRAAIRAGLSNKIVKKLNGSATSARIK